MPIIHEDSQAGGSSPGGALGNEIVFSVSSPADGWLICACFAQDNPGTAISVDTTGWTTLETVDLGNGVAYWCGYIYWHTGDPTTLPSLSTTEEAVGVTQVFSGTDEGITPLSAQRTVATSETPVATPSIPDTSSGGNVGVTPVFRYNVAGTGNAFRAPFDVTDFNEQSTGSGGNAIDSGKTALLGYKIGASDGTNFGPFHFTPRGVGIDADCEAHSMLAVFFAPGTTFLTPGGWTVGSIRAG